MNLKKSYRSKNTKRRKNVKGKKSRTAGKSSRRQRIRYRRKSKSVIRKRQKGGYQANVTAAVANNCVPVVSDSNAFQQTFEPVKNDVINSTNNYLMLNNETYVKYK
jgi:hypothetical protein